MHGELVWMRRELQDVRNELRNARQLSGQTIEIFGAHMPSMAADLGLTREPSEIFLPMLLILDFISA